MAKSERNPTALYCDDPSLTKQSFKEECDINEILRRSALTGQIDLAPTREAIYADISNLLPYHEALNLINKSQELFMTLDANVRERFQNDPGQLLAFLDDPKNRPEAEKLGLVVAKAPPSPAEEPPQPKA